VAGVDAEDLGDGGDVDELGQWPSRFGHDVSPLMVSTGPSAGLVAMVLSFGSYTCGWEGCSRHHGTGFV
jgi:hypothetical protein